jgi:two-component system sensor histidine kinase PilS (NtrC family)
VTLADGADDQALALDARRVEAVVAAVVQNALEAGGNVTLEVTPSSVRVVDDGPGLAPALALRLFEVGATTRPTAAGLGLFLARRLAEQQGATLTVRNGERGVRVELTLEP